MRITVTALLTTPVKGLRVASVDALQLGRDGAPDDRRFYLVDRAGRIVNGKHAGALTAVVAGYDAGRRALRLTFPDGTVVAAAVELGDPIATRLYSRPASARPVLGPFSDALSEHAGRPLRLVEQGERLGVDRGRGGAVSLSSRASLATLSGHAGSPVDGRRFRMLIEVDGLAPHGEDAWVGRRVRAGAALLRINGNVGRCLVTSRDPDSGVVDLPTLDLLRAYRGAVEASEPLPFGVYGEVLEPGAIAVGDAVGPA